jgi:D-glycero-beta-D-manno-heptose 1-phosphate adenylyltransferase
MMKNTAEKIYALEDLKKVLKNWQDEGKKVVFTNGCFDIVHLGHIDYLEKAHQKGDKLVVGLNTDASVKRLKGETRPVIPEYARARMLAALEFVDAVVLFAENTPQALIETLKPDVLTKGNDYALENIVGADFVLANGGKVETLPLVDGFSTSQIIEKIKQSMLGGD